MNANAPLALGSFGLPGTPQPAGGLTQARADALKQAFVDIKRAVRQISFNRHRPEAFGGWMSGPFEELSLLLRSGTLEVAIEVSTLTCEGTPILEDDQRELNIVYPLFQEGVRLLVFKPGMTLNELIQFYMGVCELDDPDKSEDLITRLWKKSFAHIEWVVVSLDDQVDADADEGALEALRARVSEEQRHLGDGVTNGSHLAKVSLQEIDAHIGQVMQIRTSAAYGGEADEGLCQALQAELVQDEAQLLDKVCALVLSVLRLPTSPSEEEDLLTALARVVDGLIAAGRFPAFMRLLTGIEQLVRSPDVPPQNIVIYKEALVQLGQLMSEARRVRAVNAALPQADEEALHAVGEYLHRLQPAAVPTLLELVESQKDPKLRRLLADAVVRVCRGNLTEVMERLSGARADFARELLYIIDRVNPDDKLDLYARLLKNEDAGLRNEVMASIARQGGPRAAALLVDIMRTHPVPQMRTGAMRLLPRFAGDRSVLRALIEEARHERFDERPELEKKALLVSLAQVEHPDALGFFQRAFEQKSGMFRKKQDEKKLLLVQALSAAASLPVLQLLVAVTKDDKTHSKEVIEAARHAALAIKQQLLGGAAARREGT